MVEYDLSQTRQGKTAEGIERTIGLTAGAEEIEPCTEAACFGQCRHVYATQIGNTRKGTHSSYCDIVHEPNIAAHALWMHRSVTVVLLERTYAGVRPIANSTKTGIRRGRADGLLNWGQRQLGSCHGCCSKTYAMNLLPVLQRQHSSTRGTLKNAEHGTNMNKDGFAFANTFTGCTEVEGAPRGRLDMVEEHIGCYLPVGTRARRVGTGGHSTRTGVSKYKPARVLYPSTTLPHGGQAPKCMFGSP